MSIAAFVRLTEIHFTKTLKYSIIKNERSYLTSIYTSSNKNDSKKHADRTVTSLLPAMVLEYLLKSSFLIAVMVVVGFVMRRTTKNVPSAFC